MSEQRPIEVQNAEPRRNMPATAAEKDAAENAAFDAAVEALANSRLAALEERLLEKVKSAVAPADAGSGSAPSVMAVLESLGMAFASLSAQGVGVQKPVSPEVLHAREEAHKLMVERIRNARRDGVVPLYRLRAPVYLDEAFVVATWTDSDHIAQPTDIEWPGVPNLAMTALNEPARLIMEAYKDSIGNMGRVERADELKEFNRGLNIKGPTRRERAESPAGEFDAGSPYEGLKIRHKNARGKARLTHVLGTIADPAQIAG